MIDAHERAWREYAERELRTLKPILARLGYALDAEQPHLLGERYLTQAVTTASGPKLILLAARTSDGARAVVKATRDARGKEELRHERRCRQTLHAIRFAYELFVSPDELFFGTRGAHLISIQAFIEQDGPFISRPLKEQFAYALGAFKAQEGAHATTYGHERVIRKTFGSMDAPAYLELFAGFRTGIEARFPEHQGLLAEAAERLAEGAEVIEQYGNFLTHTDFVPHNIRINAGQIYLLDYSALRFGNKYEGWARFVNFMALYNPSLEQALVEYVRENRTPEESRSLTLMRIYRLGEIIWYYTRNLERSEGDLLALNLSRVSFWSSLLGAVLEGRTLNPKVRDEYVRTRDALRSEGEKRRQQGLH